MRIDAHATPAIVSRRAVLTVPFLLAGCRREPENARVDVALAPLIPRDTTSLLGIRFDLLKKTPVWDKLFPEGKPGPLASFEKRTGIDVRKQLYEGIFAMGGKHRLALVRGKFTDGGVANAGREPEIHIEGAIKMPYKNFLLIGQEEYAATFLNESVLLAGRSAALRAAIDSRSDARNVPEKLLALVQSVPHAGHIYFVSTDPRLPEGGIGGVKSLPLRLQTLRAWIDPTGAVTLNAEAQGASEEDAKKLAEGIRGMTGIVRAMLKGEQAEMRRLLDGIQVTTEGTTTRVTAALPLESIDGALRMLDGIAANGA